MNYTAALLSLMPRGLIWSRSPDGALAKLMAGLAVELQRIDDRGGDLLAESITTTISETLASWEADLALPEGCNPPTATDQRLAAVQQKYRMYGSQNRAFFQALAEAFGITAEIQEYTESAFGGDFGGVYAGRDWAFVVEVILRSLNETEDTLARTEQTILRYLHAHKILISQRHETRNIELSGQQLTYNGTPLLTTIQTTRAVTPQSCN